MYDNIGRKIKGLAKALFIVEAIVAFIAGIVLMAIDEDFILLGLLFMFLMPVAAWISSWLLYGFGELVEKACDIEQSIYQSERSLRKIAAKSAEHSTTGENASVQNEIAKKEVVSSDIDKRFSGLKKLLSKKLITEEEYSELLSKDPTTIEGYKSGLTPGQWLEYLEGKKFNGDITEEEYKVQRAEIISKL